MEGEASSVSRKGESRQLPWLCVGSVGAESCVPRGVTAGASAQLLEAERKEKDELSGISFPSLLKAGTGFRS